VSSNATASEKVSPLSPPSASRIVSLSPSCTEIFFAIGAGDKVVGVTAFCDYPAEAAAKPKVGGFSGKSVSIETIVALKPDLVVMEGQMHQRLMGLLENAGVRCYAVNAVRLTDAYDIIALLGSMVGLEKNASKVVREMRSRIETVVNKTTAKIAGTGTRPSVFWEVWDDPLMTAGGSTFISEALEAAGGRNVFADTKEQYPAVSFESVLSRNPDWIMSGTDHGAKLNAHSLQKRQGWRSLSAVRNGKIALVDADSINRVGPRLASAIESLARVLHPDLFR